MSNDTDLEPVVPETTVQMYLDDRRNELAESTFQSHRYRLKEFVKWCQEEDVENLNHLTGRDIHRFRVKRRDIDDLATVTMRGRLATLRLFLRFCASYNGVTPGLDENIILPTATGEDARDEMLNTNTAEKVVDHLRRCRYATLEHAFWKQSGILVCVWGPPRDLISVICRKKNSLWRWSIDLKQERV